MAHLFFPDEELMDYFTRLMLDTGLIVYGRKTYELMIPYWPEVAKNRDDQACDIAFVDAMVRSKRLCGRAPLKTPGKTRQLLKGTSTPLGNLKTPR
jgi:dihydrofolate reductase